MTHLARAMPSGREGPVLESNRLILRPHCLEDFDAVAALWADPSVVRHITGAPISREASWSRLLRYIGHWRALGFGYWVITAREDGRFIGEAGFADYHRELTPSFAGLPEAGWVLSSTEHGLGLATETVLGMTRWADRTLPAEKTFCFINPANDASIRVASKAGYVDAGTAAYNDKAVRVMTRQKQAAAPDPRS